MQRLSDADHDAVSAAVTAAEAQTAGEIVTVVADRSDGYSDIALAWAAGVAFTALLALTLAPSFYLGLIDRALSAWGHEWTPRELFTLALGVAVLKFIAMWALQLWQPLKFALIPGAIKTVRTRDRATDLFKVGADRRTHGRTGIVIYVSLREHRAQIVADEAIASKVAPEVWGAAMTALIAEVRHGRLAEGLCAAITQVGAVLAEHFPRAEDDVNELPDRLIEL